VTNLRRNTFTEFQGRLDLRFLKSTLFEVFTHSSWVAKNYELFWIVYLLTLWFFPEIVLTVDPYALSIVPLIAILEIGYNFLNILVEMFAYFLSRVFRGNRGESFIILFILPFLSIGLFLLFNSGSYFTFIIYFYLIITNFKEYFIATQIEASKAFIRDTVFAFGKMVIFLSCTGFISVPWPEFGLIGNEIEIGGSGILVDFPHRGVPTGIIAFSLLWIIKKKLKTLKIKYVNGKSKRD